ncbi:MAG: NAD(P)H-hydrate dehydratase, partial [Bacillota bacterium]|nr:NAD(P)H-hydrate dehydratase [Bacillota bacterium]
GLPSALWEEEAAGEEGGPALELITPELARSWLPERPLNAHKGSFGHLLAVGGSAGMAGAIALCGEAALRSGAGRVTLGVPHGLWPVVASYRRELMVYGWAEDAEGRFAPAVVPGFLEQAGRATAVALGPGMGVGEGGAQLLAAALSHLSCPLVVDADGLNILAREPERFRPLVRRRLEENRPPAVLTPHPGELGRLLGLEAREVQRDRLAAARRAAREWGAVVVLKGAGTIVALPSGQAYLNATGGPHLATAGAGDVLAGVIGGLLAQGLPPGRAAALGVYLHGLAGDLAAAGETEILLAGQVAAWLGPARRRLERGG